MKVVANEKKGKEFWSQGHEHDIVQNSIIQERGTAHGSN